MCVFNNNQHKTSNSVKQQRDLQQQQRDLQAKK